MGDHGQTQMYSLAGGHRKVTMAPDVGLAKILFWNVNRKDLTDLVCLLARSTEADVIVLNEMCVASEVTLEALRREVSSDFQLPAASRQGRFHCFCRNHDLDLSEVYSGDRTSVRSLRLGPHKSLLALVHGIDIRNNDTETRQFFLQGLAGKMRFVKEQQRTNKLFVLGDFNANPYDRGMTLAAGMNAMMTRSCVAKGFRTHLKTKYELYYNPMWSLFGDNTDGPAGTVYDTSNQGPYGWSILDQVLVNHSAVHLFHDVAILDRAETQSLMDNNGRPDSKKASDHFPIFVSLRRTIDE